MFVPVVERSREYVAEVMTGNVFVHTMMSLDGFIAGPNDDMSWVFKHAGDMPSGVVDEVIARAGAVLGGRRVYDVGRRVQQPGKRGANVVNQCLESGLVDEILLHIVPELIGDGVRLFDVSTLRASLETLDVSAAGQVVNLRLRVDKAVA